MKRPSCPRAFTIVELLVVVSIIALLIGILLPAISKARDAAKMSISESNLRNLNTAHMAYIGDWADHQFTLIHDNISAYGNSNAEAFAAFAAETGMEHTPPWLGWGPGPDGFGYAHWYLVSGGTDMHEPISFTAQSGSGGDRFGSFRLINCEALHSYVSDRFYDRTYYAPKDTVALAAVEQDGSFDNAYSFHHQGYGHLHWSSYCLSPAALLQPQVMARPSQGGWQNPWTLSGGFRSPSIAQASYPSLKTHFGEHHWLQNRGKVNECHPAFEGGMYHDCEPYYFNASVSSQPLFSFYDGHIESIGVAQAIRADSRQLQQTGGDGLWSHDTYWGEDGYFTTFAYDQATTSFHIFTTDGIKGRDITSE